MTFLIPPFFMGFYGILRYHYVYPAWISVIGSVIVCYGLIDVGLYSSNRDIDKYYKERYEQYKDDVTNPKFRGLKLINKKAN